MVVQCFLHNSIRISFSAESAGVREVKFSEQHMKCWSLPNGFDFGCHALRVRLELRAFGPSPNVFVLALAFSPKWVPDVCFFFPFFFSELGTWSTVTLQTLMLLQKTPEYTHKLAPFNESQDFFKEKLHPFKPVQHTSQRDVEKASTFNL